MLNAAGGRQDGFAVAEQGLDFGVRNLEGILCAMRGPMADMRRLWSEDNGVGRQWPARTCEQDSIADRPVEIGGSRRAGAGESPAAVDENPYADATRA
ncbi:unannotated protein [freshwater metagenome]|uniref:Unannotated protein n=1 Tax=freshwater metagenome TaxID=449393 RepID=A0A6J7HJ47_9ZZZZ